MTDHNVKVGRSLVVLGNEFDNRSGKPVDALLLLNICRAFQGKDPVSVRSIQPASVSEIQEHDLDQAMRDSLMRNNDPQA